MSKNLLTFMGAVALLMISFNQQAAAAVISPVVAKSHDSNIIQAHWHGHGWHGGGGWHGHGWHGGWHNGWHHGWGWGVGGVGIGIGAPLVYSPGYYADGYYTRHCFYDVYGVRHCRRVFHYY